MKFTILTFFTEGPPHDTGADQILIEQGFQAHVKPHADNYLAFTPRKMIALDPTLEQYCKDYTAWLDQHPDSNQLNNYNKRWAKLGFQMWKPQLILHIIKSNEIAPGDIVLYHDVNFHRYPMYIQNCAEWQGLSTRILDELKCDIFIPCGLPLKNDVKAYLIRKFLGNDFFDHIGLWDGLIVMRKSKILIDFLTEWADISSQLDNISPLPNPDPHREFIWHSVDQSTVSVLAWRWRLTGRLSLDWPRYQIIGRRFAKRNIWRVLDSNGKLSRSATIIRGLRAAMRRMRLIKA